MSPCAGSASAVHARRYRSKIEQLLYEKLRSGYSVSNAIGQYTSHVEADK